MKSLHSVYILYLSLTSFTLSCYISAALILVYPYFYNDFIKFPWPTQGSIIGVSFLGNKPYNTFTILSHIKSGVLNSSNSYLFSALGEKDKQDLSWLKQLNNSWTDLSISFIL